MATPVHESDIEPTNPQLLAVSATASTLSPTRIGRTKRSFFSVIPVTSGVTVTIVFGDSVAEVEKGIVLIQNQPFSQSLDINGRGVYQGTIQAIASGNGDVAFVETFE
jgi:hypothetical protein